MSSAYVDIEAGTSSGSFAKAASFADGVVRAGFMRKVFGLLFAQLALTTAIGSWIVFNPAAKAFCLATPGLTWVAIAVSFGVLLTLCFNQQARHQHPLNLVLLGVFTAAEGYIVGLGSSMYQKEVVVQAFAMTAAVSGGLSLYALKSKTDFTSMGGFLFSMLTCLLCGMIMNLFLGIPMLNLAMSWGGAALFCVYLIYDIQILMGGTHKFAISPDEHVMACIAIYLDIVNLFLHILRILNSNRNN